MHSTTKLLAGLCAAAFVASTAAAQTTSGDTTVRRTRHIAGSGIRVTKEGPEARTGTASGIYGGTASSDTVAASASPSINASSCTGVNCPDSLNNGTLVPSHPDTMTAGDADMAMFGASDPQFLQSMTDENILAHLAMGDSMEIRMAQHALQQTQNQAVRDFANTLIADHTASLRQGQAAAQQAGIRFFGRAAPSE